MIEMVSKKCRCVPWKFALFLVVKTLPKCGLLGPPFLPSSATPSPSTSAQRLDGKTKFQPLEVRMNLVLDEIKNSDPNQLVILF